MINKFLAGPIGLLIGVAAAIGLVFGAFTYVVQARDNSDAKASVALRLHDEVVSWPNHSALQREAVASINDASGQSQIRSSLTSEASLISVEASSLGDPASVEIVARATDEATALAAVTAAADLAINQSVLDRAAPVEAQLEALKADLATAVADRDALLSQLASGIDDDAQRAVATASVESVAAVASVLQQDVARIEADLNSKASPLVAIGDAQAAAQTTNDLNSALAAAVGAFFLSLLALSMIRDNDSGVGGNQTIDLTDDNRRTKRELSASEPNRLAASVE